MYQAEIKILKFFFILILFISLAHFFTLAASQIRYFIFLFDEFAPNLFFEAPSAIFDKSEANIGTSGNFFEI